MGEITSKVVYDVLTAVVPLYVSMLFAYGSVRWWKILTSEACLGINTYVAFWAAPFLIFKFIAESNPYTMNFKFLGTDALQKVLTLTLLLIGQRFFQRSDRLDWAITFYSLTTLSNTLIMGVPLFNAFYGTYAGELMVQIVFIQFVIWNTILLVLFEFRAAMLLISKQFPHTAERIASIKVDADVASLSEKELDAMSEVDGKGKMHVSFRKMSSDKYLATCPSGRSNLNEVEIYSVSSSRMGSMRERMTGSFDGSPNPSFMNMSQIKKSQSLITSHDNLASERRGYHDKQFGVEEASSPPSSRGFTYGSPFKESKDGGLEGRTENPQAMKMPSQSVMVKVAMTMAWRKLSKAPTTYASIIGLVWALIANNSRIHITMPAIVKGSYHVISDGGVGLIMFSLGLFIASQEKPIPCGKKAATLAMFLRFVVSPAVIAITSLPFRLRGDILRIAILQATLPQAILSFVYARQYDVHPELLSTAVIMTTLLALPVALLYFTLLEF